MSCNTSSKQQQALQSLLTEGSAPACTCPVLISQIVIHGIVAWLDAYGIGANDVANGEWQEHELLHNLTHITLWPEPAQPTCSLHCTCTPGIMGWFCQAAPALSPVCAVLSQLCAAVHIAVMQPSVLLLVPRPSSSGQQLSLLAYLSFWEPCCWEGQ